MTPKKRIIFVDDELQILQGLRRTLSRQSPEWEMTFVTSGSAALTAMAAASFDVIVSDMRMPEMDGATLLEKVRNLYPQVARIALSGQSEQEMILRAVGSTHQYLSKPCVPELLKSTITRACALRECLKIPKLQQVVSGMSYLPSLPSLYLELLAEVNSTKISLEKVSRIISNDLGMTAKILQIANSEFFGLSQHIATAREAVTYLGLDVIRSLLLTFNIFSELNLEGLDKEHFTELWNHSLIVGVCARQIANAEGVGIEMANQSFTAGLLHDIARLVIALNLPEQRKRIFVLSGAEQIPYLEAEREVVAASHMEIGAYLLGLWGLPDSIVEATIFHHNPGDCTAKKFSPLTAVHVADCLYWQALGLKSGEARAAQFDLAYLDTIGMADHVADWQILCQVTLEEQLSEDLRSLVIK